MIKSFLNRIFRQNRDALIEHKPLNRNDKDEPYLELCFFLWSRIDALDASEKEKLKGYEQLAWCLQESFRGVNDYYLSDGFLKDVCLWADLKRSGSDLTNRYRDGFFGSYPEVFAGHDF